jgi:hypothetical protein
VAPVVDEVVAPVVDEVVAPVVAEVIVPVVDEVVAPVAAEVVAPVVEIVLPEILAAPVISEIVEPLTPVVAGSEALAQPATPVAPDVLTTMTSGFTATVAGPLSILCADRMECAAPPTRSLDFSKIFGPAMPQVAMLETMTGQPSVLDVPGQLASVTQPDTSAREHAGISTVDSLANIPAPAATAVAVSLLLPIIWVLGGSTAAGGSSASALSQAPTKDSQTSRTPLGGGWQAFLEPLAALEAIWSCLRMGWSTGHCRPVEFAPVPPRP